MDDLENRKFPLFSCPPAPTSSVVPFSVTSNPPLQQTLFQKDCAEDDLIFSTPMKPKSTSFSASLLVLASAFAPRQLPRNTASSSASSAPSVKNRSFLHDLPKFDLDNPKISNPLTFICALEFHLQDDQLPECWYKAHITSIVNPSAKAWALSHLDLPRTPWTSVKAIFFNHFVPQSSNFVTYKKLCHPTCTRAPPLPFTTSPPPSKPTSSTSTAEQHTCYKCKQQGHLASSCPNKTNKNSSGLFALTTGYNNDDPPNNVHDDDNDDDPPAIAIHFGSPPGPSATLSYLQCDDVDSYYEYCRAINELVEDSLDHNLYASL
ncbi:hypothetical protein QOT17_000782 [Balamuthia mandrillaris]